MSNTLLQENLKRNKRKYGNLKKPFFPGIDNYINILELKTKLENSPLRDNIECLLFYGSMRNKIDQHKLSDFDFHMVFKNIEPNTFQILKDIIKGFENFDLSIHELSEIITKKGKLIFQNGTQGQYFVHVLAQAETIIGKNIYKDFMYKINEKEVQKSIKFKVREYLWKIRKMIIEDINPIYFKKYAIRLIKDVLLYDKIILYSEINEISNNYTLDLFLKKYKKHFKQEELHSLINLSTIEMSDSPDYSNIACILAKISSLIIK